MQIVSLVAHYAPSLGQVLSLRVSNVALFVILDVCCKWDNEEIECKRKALPFKQCWIALV